MDSAKQLKELLEERKNLEKRLKELDAAINKATVTDILNQVENLGIAFISDDFAYLNKLCVVQAKLYVPILEGKPRIDKSYVLVGKDRYNVPQPDYLKDYTDDQIINEADNRKQNCLVYYDVAILPKCLAKTTSV
jgi:hypothetical protein